MSKYDLYIGEILRAIDLIEKEIRRVSYEKFIVNRTLYDATCMRLQIIGESIIKLPKEFKIKNNEINWERFIQTRNIISHAYSSINEKILWDIIKKDVPLLKKQILKLKKELK